MINEVEGLITQAIGRMEIDKATSISGEIEMGNGDEYRYTIQKKGKGSVEYEPGYFLDNGY